MGLVVGVAKPSCCLCVCKRVSWLVYSGGCRLHSAYSVQSEISW
jgi:hypothetical protein